MKKEDIAKEIKRVKRNRKIGIGFLMVLNCLVLVSFVNVFASYIAERRVANAISSSEFYFSVVAIGDPDDTLGFDPMLHGEPQALQYRLENNATIHLYSRATDNGHFSETVNIKNFLDDLRITQKDISYDISFEVKNKDDEVYDINNKVSVEDDKLTYSFNETLNLAIIDGEKLENKILTSSTKTSDSLVIKIPKLGGTTLNGDYEGAKVIVNIKSTKPYVKNYQITYVLHNHIPSERYLIKDNSDHLELIIKSDTGYLPAEGASDNLKIYYPKDLIADKSDPLILNSVINSENADFNYVEISGSGIKQSSTTSIKFFKANNNNETSVLPLSETEIAKEDIAPSELGTVKVVTVAPGSGQ